MDAATQTEGRLQPPLSDDGRNYTNGAATTWSLLAAAEQRVLLMLSDLDLEEQAGCLYDGVVMSNTTRGPPVCGRVEEGLAALSLENFAEVGDRSCAWCMGCVRWGTVLVLGAWVV